MRINPSIHQSIGASLSAGGGAEHEAVGRGVVPAEPGFDPGVSTCWAKAQHPRLSPVLNSKVVDGGPSATTMGAVAASTLLALRGNLHVVEPVITHRQIGRQPREAACRPSSGTVFASAARRGRTPSHFSRRPHPAMVSPHGAKCDQCSRARSQRSVENSQAAVPSASLAGAAALPAISRCCGLRQTFSRCYITQTSPARGKSEASPQ